MAKNKCYKCIPETRDWCYSIDGVLHKGSYSHECDEEENIVNAFYFTEDGEKVNDHSLYEAVDCPDCAKAKPVNICGGAVSITPPACKSYFARALGSDQPFSFEAFNEFTIEYPPECQLLLTTNIGVITLDGGKYGGSLCSGQFCADIEDLVITGTEECLENTVITVKHF